MTPLSFRRLGEILLILGIQLYFSQGSKGQNTLYLTPEANLLDKRINQYVLKSLKM
jgi:hypothetical protein